MKFFIFSKIGFPRRPGFKGQPGTTQTAEKLPGEISHEAGRSWRRRAVTEAAVGQICVLGSGHVQKKWGGERWYAKGDGRLTPLRC